jgi:NAD dependent epimerase/dehydratase family enzyme
MSKVFNRPSLLPVPAFALKTILGEFSQEVLGSARVIPQVLMDAGFVFQDPDIESAMRTLAAK